MISIEQIALSCGFIASVLLAFSVKVGVITRDGRYIFEGLDDMAPIEKNIKIVKYSHIRNRLFTPVGWGLLAFSFVLQLLA